MSLGCQTPDGEGRIVPDDPEEIVKCIVTATASVALAVGTSAALSALHLGGIW